MSDLKPLIKTTKALIDYMEITKINKIPENVKKHPKITVEFVKKYFDFISLLQDKIQNKNNNTGNSLTNLLLNIKQNLKNSKTNKININMVAFDVKKFYDITLKYYKFLTGITDKLIPSVSIFSMMSNTKGNLDFGKNAMVIPVERNISSNRVVSLFDKFFFQEVRSPSIDVIFMGVSGAGKSYLSQLFYEYVTKNRVNNKKLFGILRSQYVSVFYPTFDIKRNGKTLSITVNDCQIMKNERKMSYEQYRSNYIKPTPFNGSSSRAHLIYSLPAMVGLKLNKTSRLPGKVINIVDLCGFETHKDMVDKCFGFDILSLLKVDLMFLMGLFPPGAASSINTFNKYLALPNSEKKKKRPERLVSSITRFMDQAKNKANPLVKKLYSAMKNKIIWPEDLFIFTVMCKMITPSIANATKLNGNASKFEQYFKVNPDKKIRDVTTFGTFFDNHPEEIKNYTISEYFLEMTKRCLESYYIEKSLNNVTDMFFTRKITPNSHNNKITIKTGKLASFLKNNSSKKYLFGVVNTTITDNSLKKLQNTFIEELAK